MQITTRTRALLGALVLCPVLALTACGQPSGTASPEGGTTMKPQQSARVDSNLDAIKVEGEPLKQPKVTVPAPWSIDKTQVKVLKEGNGPEVQPDGIVDVWYQGVDGRTGAIFDDAWNPPQGFSPTSRQFPLNGVVNGFKLGLQHQKVGSRVLIAMTGPDGYDNMGGRPKSGIQVGDTLIFVVDIVATSLTGPQGSPVEPKAGFPTVTRDATPKVTVPSGYKVPATTEVMPVIAGTGATIEPDDTVTVNYQMISLKTGEVLEQSYGKKPETGSLSNLIKGWQKGLPGQKVGSRVLLVVPKSEAYADKDDLAFVVDILFRVPAAQA